MGIERRDFARLQYHRATRGDGRGDLAANLVQRPVPGRDQRAHAHRFAANQRCAELVFELERLENLAGLGEMREAERHLGVAGEPGGCTHLGRHGAGQICGLRGIGSHDALEDRDALLGSGLRERHERGLGCGNGAVHVGLAPQGDLGDHLGRSRVFNIERAGNGGRSPLAVDIEEFCVGHEQRSVGKKAS